MKKYETKVQELDVHRKEIIQMVKVSMMAISKVLKIC